MTLRILRRLKVSFPGAPDRSSVHLRLSTVATLFGRGRIRDLVSLPRVARPDGLTTVQVLSDVAVTTRVTTSSLVPLLTTGRIDLSVRCNGTFISPSTCTALKLILYKVVKGVSANCRFKRLTLGLLSRPRACMLGTEALLVIGDFVVR